MDEKLLEILISSGEINEQELLAYVQGKSTPEEKHKIEKLLAESEFANDAAEGLDMVENKDHIPYVLNDLNRHLVKKLIKKRRKMTKRGLPDLIIPAVAMIFIILVFMIYLYLRKRLHG
ncbi:MAG: hypothetical protein C5B52_07400 [Bacteroidetes bacterium]|nr:MAG: hypothetical protein C5B52_07400 [Bacteroidota bacterium]